MTRSRMTVGRAAALAAVLLVGLAAWIFTGGSSGGQAAHDPLSPSRARFQAETGIRVIRVAVTGGGGLVDLRYQVIDPDKAQVVHLRTPRLIDERTGQVIDTPFMGHSHGGGQAKAGYTYPLLFVNENGVLTRGSAVSVVIGNSLWADVDVG
jgi:hypothetical protein